MYMNISFINEMLECKLIHMQVIACYICITILFINFHIRNIVWSHSLPATTQIQWKSRAGRSSWEPAQVLYNLATIHTYYPSPGFS